jgi:hypothetical protein
MTERANLPSVEEALADTAREVRVIEDVLYLSARVEAARVTYDEAVHEVLEAQRAVDESMTRLRKAYREQAEANIALNRAVYEERKARRTKK